MSPTPRTRLAACIGTALVAMSGLAVTAPAMADELTFRDPTGDVWLYSGGEAVAPDPSHTYGDLVRTTFVHADARVVIRSRFVELRRSGELVFDTLLRDGDGRRHYLMFWTMPGQRQGMGQLFRLRRQPEDTGCRVNAKVDYEADTLRVAFSRRCLEDPRWLQFKGSVQHYPEGSGDDVYVDNPDTEAPPSGPWSSKVRRG